MKKLMIVATALAMAISAQAGKVNWASGTLNTPGMGGAFTETAVANGAVTGYLVVLSKEQYEGYLSTYNSDGFAAMETSVYNAYKDSLGSITLKGTTTDGKITLTDNVNKTSGYIYAALIYTLTQDGTDYYIADIGRMQYSASQQTAQAMGTTQLGSNTKDKTTTAITGWQSVPEPTSGLLLLLGVAGLALKRKRA